MRTCATTKRARECLRAEQYNLLSKHKMLLLLTWSFQTPVGIPIFQCVFVMLAFERGTGAGLSANTSFGHHARNPTCVQPLVLDDIRGGGDLFTFYRCVCIIRFCFLCSSLCLTPTCGFKKLTAALKKVVKQLESGSADVQQEAAGALLLIVSSEWNVLFLRKQNGAVRILSQGFGPPRDALPAGPTH